MRPACRPVGGVPGAGSDAYAVVASRRRAAVCVAAVSAPSPSHSPESSPTPADDPREEASSPAPFDLLSVPPEERDRAWVEHYYQGDHVPQLTWRAVLMGGVLGMAMSVANLYTTLKLGWAFGVAITACVLSYAIWNAFVALGLAKTKMTMLENNCMQSTASAAGYSTGGTLATAVGALLLVTGDEGRMSWIPVTIWVVLVALLGVFLAIPMKRQMINQEQLPFPSGIAAAETLRSLYAKGTESVHKARALLSAMATGIVMGLVRSIPYTKTRGGEALTLVPSELPLGFDLFSVKGRTVNGHHLAGFAFEPSLLLIAAGMIVGLRVSASMLFGGLLNYLVLVPYAMRLPDWTDGQKTFIGHLEVLLGDSGELTVVKVTKWSLWLGTSLMVTSGLASFALGWRTILRAVTSLRDKGREGTAEDPVARLEVPMRWLVAGLVPTTIGLVFLCWLAMDIHPVLGLLSVVLSFVLALVACRATGETDTTPIGAMGKITQFVYAVLAPANKTVNLMTAGITAGAAGSSADLLTDLKSGYLLGANPRQQFLAQFYGVFFGVVAVVPAWYLLVPDKSALEAFHPPATNMWYAVAEALSVGIQTIPESARYAIVIGGIAGVVLVVVEALLPARARRFVPSAMGLGLAFVVPFQNALSFFVGAVIAEVWRASSKKSAERFVVPLASGAVAGESLATAASAIAKNLMV
jgi:OPT family oligopeptide transporter